MATDSGVQQARMGGGGARSIPLWVPGDWNAFFGLFTNVILNMLVLTGLVLGVVSRCWAFVGPAIRRYTRRGAMLGTLAGSSMAFISLRPAFQSWGVPWIGFVLLTLVLVSWTAGIRLPGNIPAGLAAVIVGTA